MEAEHTGSTEAYDVDRVWKLIDKIKICMLATRAGEGIRARPMSAIARESENAIYLLTDAEGHKDDEIAQNGNVCLVFAKPEAGKFLSVNGRARVLDDRALIGDLWSAAAEAWWESPQDPTIRAIEIIPEQAEFWEGPHGLIATIEMVIAASTAAPPVMGDQRKVDLH